MKYSRHRAIEQSSTRAITQSSNQVINQSTNSSNEAIKPLTSNGSRHDGGIAQRAAGYSEISRSKNLEKKLKRKKKL